METHNDKRRFVAQRLDEIIGALETSAPGPGEQSPVPTSGEFDGSLVAAQRHRAEIETASDERLDEIAAGYPEIAAAWERDGSS
ncbi:hypothetical protein D092_14645 [Rhodococcus ruber Chol-4]|uniref:Uncharacterized protein n=3 Tax=Rhodococcus TaxID=1827 RepID=M2YKU9_9NOCA|nr:MULTISPECIES: hypothetical protein [Rhodococcus]RIK03636.1 MAG: hypothetical protein DCC47_20315 [Acidobacteriota bacterium]AUM19999.1 hypothetical protein CSW53_21880 [Rhodococcus ruber]AWH01345.1 hypothetical protein DCN13_23605 [Rhodococcus ruber]AXY54694.1 hypothetical protein YT1_5305 [Rhodococcus ruber]EME55352.1 hypothetical protein G352_23101 [Rhodococcus ruber BKS 20-38]